MRKARGRGVRHGDLAGLVLIALSVIAGLGLVTGAQSNASLAVLATVCNVFNTIKNVIFILGLTLMLLGAAIYSGANLMPSQSRGPFQGYGMSMIVGGVVGTAIAVASPFILNTVVRASGGSAAVFNGSTLLPEGTPATPVNICNAASQYNPIGGEPGLPNPFNYSAVGGQYTKTGLSFR